MNPGAGAPPASLWGVSSPTAASSQAPAVAAPPATRTLWDDLPPPPAFQFHFTAPAPAPPFTFNTAVLKPVDHMDVDYDAKQVQAALEAFRGGSTFYFGATPENTKIAMQMFDEERKAAAPPPPPALPTFVFDLQNRYNAHAAATAPMAETKQPDVAAVIALVKEYAHTWDAVRQGSIRSMIMWCSPQVLEATRLQLAAWVARSERDLEAYAATRNPSTDIRVGLEGETRHARTVYQSFVEICRSASGLTTTPGPAGVASRPQVERERMLKEVKTNVETIQRAWKTAAADYGNGKVPLATVQDLERRLTDAKAAWEKLQR